MPKVWHIKDKAAPKGAVYVGRGSPYGNPFKIGPGMTRARAIAQFRCEILPNLDVSKLRGRDLVCFCKPLECHGDWILEKANG